jgi:maltose-binding protein MalE
MYQVVVNRETLQNHLHYDWWKYVVGIVVTVMLWNLVSTMTRPQTPPDKKVDIFLVGDYLLEENAEPISQRMLEDFPELLEINFMNIPLGGDPELEIMGRQKLMVVIGAQEGDIFVFSKQEYETFAKQGAFMPLDEYIDDEITKYIPAEELEKYKLSVEYEYAQDKQPHIYGIPLKGVTIFNDTGYNVEDKVLSIMAYSKNKEKAIEVMKWIVTKGR